MVHQYQLNGYNIVLDTCSGSVHVVDDVAYDVIAMYQDHTADEIVSAMMDKYGSRPDVTEEDLRQCIDDVTSLKEAGKLWSPDVYENMAFDFKNRSTVVKALCLHVAHTCNLNCSYCFASQGKYHGDRALMSYEVGKQALDFLMDHSGTRHNLEVDFFGGEPLMAMDTVKATVEYARAHEKEWGKHFRFTMTTNGVLLSDENIKYFNENMDNCVLSLDGRKEVNDRNRLTVNGKGSYDMIVPKFLKLIEQRDKNKDYYVRGTFTHENLDFSQDVLSIADLGVDSISVEPVTADDSDPYALREEDLPTIYAEYERLAKIMLKRKDFNFFHFNVDLTQGPCVIKRMRGCGAGCEYVAVTPDGELYPCHQFVGKEEYRMGSVLTDEFNMDIANTFAGLNIYTREDCQDCWARFYCSGGCSAANLNANGDMKKPYKLGCDMQRKRLECAIAMRAIEAGLAEIPEK